MFYDEYNPKGKCFDGKGHEADGLLFSLPYGLPASPMIQDNWQYCEKCHAIFYDGSSDKGRCAGAGGHNKQAQFGINFTLSHSVGATASAQSDWRKCKTCQVMFYDGWPHNKGKCPGGTGHVGDTYNFVLPHKGMPPTSLLTPAELKWMGLPLPALGEVALGEFSNAFKQGAKEKIPDDWITQLDAKISADPNGFKLGFAMGTLKGLLAGLKGLVEGIIDLVKLGIVLSTPNLVITAATEAFFLLTDPARLELRKRQAAAIEQIIRAAAKTFEDINRNPDDYIVLSREMGEALGKSAGNWFSQDFLKRSAKDIGETVGEIAGQILFEIILQIIIELTTAGIGNAARAGVAAGQGARGGTRVASIIEILKPVLRRSKGLQKFIMFLIRDERGVLILGKLRIPRVLQLETGGRYFTRVPHDAKLLELAAEFRMAKVGLSEEAFFQNVAVARVKVWPSEAAKAQGLPHTIEYIVADNIPGKMQHSEGLVLDKFQALKKQKKWVSIDQWYSERVPCVNCKAYVLNNNANASIYYTVNEEAGRSAELMKQYGLTP